MCGFSLVATAQESTYSADSLMSAFKSGSKQSLKGSEITFTGVVAESRSSKVIFKSSENDRVICELASSTENHNAHFSVGSPLTVTGRVRGRGLLGNVTLDECSLMPAKETIVVPEVILAETPAAVPATVPDVVPQEVPQAPTRKLERIKNEQSQSRPVDTTVAVAPPSPIGLEPPAPVIQKNSNSAQPRIPYALYAALALSGGLAFLALSKLGSAARRAMGSLKRSTYSNAPETRQAALEALLSKQKKEK